jgi:hypothetical protein
MAAIVQQPGGMLQRPKSRHFPDFEFVAMNPTVWKSELQVIGLTSDKIGL